MAPASLKILADISLAAAFLCAIIILLDIRVGGWRQKMKVMELVWPLNALYWGPVALWAYYRIGRQKAERSADRPAFPPSQPERGSNGHNPAASNDQEQPQGRPTWQSVGLSASHCGAGCALGDIIADWSVFAAGFTVLGNRLGGYFTLDFALAWLFGIAFQYFAIVPMKKLPPGKGIIESVKADTLSIASFQIGMYGWMAITHYLLFRPPLAPNSGVYWFMMQIAMILGFFTAWPVNIWLLRRGVKEAMSRPQGPFLWVSLALDPELTYTPPWQLLAPPIPFVGGRDPDAY